MRTPFEQVNAAVTVDKTLGTAFTVVKEVSEKLDLLEYLALNMESIVRAASVSQENVVITSTLPTRGTSKIVAFPAGISATNVMAIHAKASVDSIYFLSGKGEAITTSLSSSGIVIAVDAAAPLSLESAPVTILVVAMG